MKLKQTEDKLKSTREICKNFFQEKYKEKIEPYKDIIKQVMKANKLDEIPALLKVSETEVFNQSEINSILFISATVEIIEENPEKNESTI